MVGPRSWISPDCEGLEDVGSGMICPVSVSTRRASTDGRGQPTLPSMRSAKERPQLRAMPTSVMP